MKGNLKKFVCLGVRIFTRAVVSGIVFFILWVGIGMFPIMDAPDNVIVKAYRDGAMLSAIVAVIVLLLVIFFWKRHGRLLSFDDLNLF